MSTDRRPVSLKWLLSLYLIIPLCVLTQLLDAGIFGGILQQQLPADPQQVFIYNFLFGTPHILASSLILVTNNEYRRFYHKNLIVASALIIGFLSLGAFFLSYKFLFIIIATISIAHVIKQQVGIGNISCRLSGSSYQLWVWSGIAAGAIIFNIIFIRSLFTPTQIQVMEQVMLMLLICFAALTLLQHKNIQRKEGARFLWANFSLVAVPAYLYFQDYFFLAVLAPRIIHDLTAFTVYVVHDHNRHYQAPQNTLFRFAQKYRFPVVLITPVVAILIAYLVQYHLDGLVSAVASNLLKTSIQVSLALGLISFCNLFHYYTETFTWGSGSPYRKYVPFKG